MHDLQHLLSHPTGAENPVIGSFVAILKAVEDVIPDVRAIVMEDGLGPAGGHLDGVEQEFEMSRDVHGASVCWFLHRETIGVFFLFTRAPSRWVKNKEDGIN